MSILSFVWLYLSYHYCTSIISHPLLHCLNNQRFGTKLNETSIRPSKPTVQARRTSLPWRRASASDPAAALRHRGTSPGDCHRLPGYENIDNAYQTLKYVSSKRQTEFRCLMLSDVFWWKIWGQESHSPTPCHSSMPEAQCIWRRGKGPWNPPGMVERTWPKLQNFERIIQDAER